MKVYQAINAIQRELSKAGIAKTRKNQQQGYMFRGIDEVYAALSPLLAEHGLCILPRMLSREVVERTTQKGNALFYVTVDAEFDFVCVEDGSKHIVKTFGEAMDSADKATNKAMSAAYKYAAFQAFGIPTEGDNDADATTHDVRASGTSGCWAQVPENRRELVRRIGEGCLELVDDIEQLYTYLYTANLDKQRIDNDEFVCIWEMLQPFSKQRNQLKRMRQDRTGALAMQA